jgi:hypothetical protein
MKEQQRSALVELVMPEASEEEKEEASRHWFSFLETLGKIVDEEERQKQRSDHAANP